MKLFISSFFICSSLYASPIRVYHENLPDNADAVKDIFVNGYGIPADLVGLKVVKTCEELKERRKLDLCLKNNGDLLVVSVDKRFINESLRIFQAP